MISGPYNSGCICFQNCGDWEDYTIQEKDTLYNISVKFGVPIRMLMTCNRLLNPYNLRVGQIIKVPPNRPELIGCVGENEETYIIQLKDTLYTIAENMDSTVEDIMQRNPGLDPYNLKPGMRICVPKRAAMPTAATPEDSVPTAELPEDPAPMAEIPEPLSSIPTMAAERQMESESVACDGRTYTVKEGDSLESLLETFDFTYATMAIANPNINLFQLTPGTRLCIPVSDLFAGCNSGTTYIIRNGDTLSSLSDRFDVSQSRMMSANPFMRTTDFSVAGNRVCIPD